MKKILIITGCAAMAIGLFSCGSDKDPGRSYVPDMTYSPAYETYTPTGERLKNSEAETTPLYTTLPVQGTIARGDVLPYSLKNDSAGYANSATVKNPLDIASIDMKEAERLYLINCGICHGAKLDGNGPLYNGGNGPFLAAPKDFTSDDMKKMTEGTMFHSVTYGKGQMGSYASQLQPDQRWMIIAYIKEKQGAGVVAADSSGAAKPDSSAAATAMK